MLGAARLWRGRITPSETLRYGAGVQADSDNRGVSVDADWRNAFGRVQGSLQQSVGEGGAQTAYAGGFAVNTAQLEGDVHVGGDENDRAAVIVETKGDAAGAMLEVVVNGVSRARVRVGKRQALYLSPFHTYRVHVKPEGGALDDYDAVERNVTLYPGNVAKLAWEVNRFSVVVGKIVTPDGAPLKDAIIQESKEQAATDASGRIQAELTRPSALHLKDKDGRVCRVTLPRIAPLKEGVLIYREALVCR